MYDTDHLGHIAISTALITPAIVVTHSPKLVASSCMMIPSTTTAACSTVTTMLKTASHQHWHGLNVKYILQFGCAGSLTRSALLVNVEVHLTAFSCRAHPLPIHIARYPSANQHVHKHTRTYFCQPASALGSRATWWRIRSSLRQKVHCQAYSKKNECKVAGMGQHVITRYGHRG
jgi:hypothetical protein